MVIVDNIYVLLIIIIVLNLFIVYILINTKCNNDVVPNKHFYDNSTLINNPSIVDNIKKFYKISAIKHNDNVSEIIRILKIKLIETNNDLYYDVLYIARLPDNITKEGKRRFTINKNGDIINMGQSGSALTV